MADRRLVGVVALVAMLGACTSKPSAGPTSSPSVTPASSAPSPTATATNGFPPFTNPTAITNPYFPISSNAFAVEIGTEAGKPARVEVTLLPGTRKITWSNGTTETVVSQFVAYRSGRMVEVAYDYFAQADDGSVWYFGEDVANYSDGRVTDHEGTWLAGKGGAPPGLIMPASPKVGDKFNPENLPKVVFETDRVVSITASVQTPDGPASDGIDVEETLMDGSIEHKLYARGFGIVQESTEDELQRLVARVKAGDPSKPVPDPVTKIQAAAADIIAQVPGGNWSRIQADTKDIRKTWSSYKPVSKADGVPQAFADALEIAVKRLEFAAGGRKATNTTKTANDVSAAIADILSLFNPAVPADLGRLDVLGRRVVLDVAAKSYGAAADDVATAEAIWARLKPKVLAMNGSRQASDFARNLAAQAKAVKARNAKTATNEARAGLELIDAMERLF